MRENIRLSLLVVLSAIIGACAGADLIFYHKVHYFIGWAVGSIVGYVQMYFFCALLREKKEKKDEVKN